MNVKSGYDCVVVGSGASGGTLSYGLAKKGCKVLLVESGDFVKPPAAHDPLDARIGFAQSEYGPSGSLPCVGGPTKFYGSALYRLREMDFQRTQLETGESAGWPVSYAEMEPYYADAERVYAVHGSSAGDPSEPHRASPYPYPPIPHQGMVKSLVASLEAQGTPVGHIPRGLDYRDGGKCVLCATCDGYYCRLDAKMDSEIACVRPAVATGNVELLTRTECLRVLLSPDGKRAVGVELRQGSGVSTIYADRVAICAGVMQSPLLLRRSRTAAHPEGIGNDHGSLGRYMCGHTVVTLVVVMGLTPLPPMHSKTFAINSFYGPSNGWPYPLGVIQMAGQLPTFDQPAHVRALLARSFVCFCMSEEPSSKDGGLTFAGDDLSPHVIRAKICKKTSNRLAWRAARPPSSRVAPNGPEGAGPQRRLARRRNGAHGHRPADLGRRFSLCGPRVRESLRRRFIDLAVARSRQYGAHVDGDGAARGRRDRGTARDAPDGSGCPGARRRDDRGDAMIAEMESNGITVQTPAGPVRIAGAIYAKWREAATHLTPDGDDVQAHLGPPLGEAQAILSAHGGGASQLFTRGMIVARANGQAFVVYGAIYDYYLGIGGPANSIGQPTSDEESAARGGRVAHFENGDIYWHEDFGPRDVRGFRRKHYAARGYPFTRSLFRRAASRCASTLRRLAIRLRSPSR